MTAICSMSCQSRGLNALSFFDYESLVTLAKDGIIVPLVLFLCDIYFFDIDIVGWRVDFYYSKGGHHQSYYYLFSLEFLHFVAVERFIISNLVMDCNIMC